MIFNEYFRLKAGKTSKMNKCGTNDCVEGGFFRFHYHHPCMLQHLIRQFRIVYHLQMITLCPMDHLFPLVKATSQPITHSMSQKKFCRSTRLRQIGGASPIKWAISLSSRIKKKRRQDPKERSNITKTSSSYQLCSNSLNIAKASILLKKSLLKDPTSPSTN